MAEWQIEFYEDENGKRPVEKWMRSLEDDKFSAITKAHDSVLCLQGINLLQGSWLKALGGGIYEFRVRHSAEQIEGLYTQKKRGVAKQNSNILLREFIAFRKGKIILLLGAYDKGEDPSKKTQQEQINLARKRLQDWDRRSN